MDGRKLARRLLLLRSWERQNMPMSSSIIAGDIVLLALARDDGDAACVKDFHLSLQYSEDSVSQVLKKMVRDGWLTTKQDAKDRPMPLFLLTSISTLHINVINSCFDNLLAA